ncbi:MAG: GIY-YIG nuclease family protein [Candidatus Liptonbacteria bacterium]|nr:GIY-YIG nuclease family protein [Candidatus Liptonbacteria bacterium]
MDKKFYVYIMTNKPRGVLYIGITSDIVHRAEQHKNEVVGGFTKKYRLHRLVYYETYDAPYDAIQREKHLKFWHRAWKIDLIEGENPAWRDLSDDF